MDPSFTRALLLKERRHRAFGLNLRPLTVGHLFLLLELENAYPDHPEEAGYPDLMTAVLVCSADHRRARRMVGSRFAPRFMRVWGFLARRLDWQKEAVAFGEYLREQLGTPQRDEIGRGGELTAPLAWRLQAMLMAEFHMSPKEALDCPVAWATTLWATEGDRRGVSKLASERQLRFRAWVKEMEAKRLAAVKAQEAEANYQADEGNTPHPGPLPSEGRGNEEGNPS